MKARRNARRPPTRSDAGIDLERRKRLLDLELLDFVATFPTDAVNAESWCTPTAIVRGWQSFCELTTVPVGFRGTMHWSAVGDAAERCLARPLPGARWHFQWADYIFVCEPDGVTDHYVYEFKSVPRRDRVSERARRAVLQARILRRLPMVVEARSVLER